MAKLEDSLHCVLPCISGYTPLNGQQLNTYTVLCEQYQIYLQEWLWEGWYCGAVRGPAEGEFKMCFC